MAKGSRSVVYEQQERRIWAAGASYMGSRSVVLEEGRVTIGQHSKGCRAPYRAEVGRRTGRK